MTPSTTFVLVHGGWHGGWCWKKVVPLLRAAGHEVFTPTLTGLGERSHLLTPDVGLETHVQDIVAVLEYEDLNQVHLIGHSYGGMVITGVASRAAQRIAQLIYLDAFLPEAGKALRDYAPSFPAPDGWRVPLPFPPQALGVTDEQDIAWMSSRLGDHPLRTLTEPVDISANALRELRQTYIQCTPYFEEPALRAKQQGFRVRQLKSDGHDPMISQPNELAAMLLDLIQPD